MASSPKHQRLPMERARALLDATLVWDNHTCMPLRPEDQSFLPQIERLRSAGVDVVSLNIGFGDIDLATHLRMIASFRDWFGKRPGEYVLVDKISDIDAARHAGKLAIVFDVEGMAPLDNGDFGMIALLRDAGVRWMLVAYNKGNRAGGGCLDDDQGLTTHGRAVLDEMKRVGIVACCSHTGHRTAMDVIEHVGNPIIFSHSNASAVYSHYRNIPDHLIRACAAINGVVGINGIAGFLGETDNHTEMMVRHIDHMVQLVGPDHVGIALDYVFDLEELMAQFQTMSSSFKDAPPVGEDPLMVPPEAIVEIVARLLSMGYTTNDLDKILGGNWERVAKAVWK